jgi:two-component system phosphate regulon sensor histidine kinase PhoR
LNRKPGLAQELWGVALLILAAWAVGALLDEIPLALCLALAAYIARSLFNLQRLADWLGAQEAGDIPAHSGIWGDIYARIARVSAHQAQRERRLTTLLNEYAASTSALPDATVALDAEGRIRWFNDAAIRLLGLQAAKDVGQPLSNLFRHPEATEFIRRADYQATLQTTSPGNSERKLEVRLAPYGEGQTLLLAQDISERLRHETVRRDFVANVSHELRTPLTVLSGFVENLQASELLQDERLRRPIELMGQQAARMRQIVEDLLLLARLEGESVRSMQQEVEVGGMLRLIADECRALGSDVAEIECDVRSARRILGDEKQLRSAVSNLVVNAAHHTPADGLIKLTWEDRGVQSRLEVSDDGEGIAAEHIPRLTERFYRIDTGRSRQRGGTGLGLAIVKHVLKRHEATLEIDSRPGEGSRFICHFPASRLLG